MKLVCLSDTHNQHDKISVPEGDVLIHAGDFSGTGTQKQVISFVRWFASQPHKHKIIVAGNHDITLDLPFYERDWHRFHKYPHPSHDLKSYLLREEGVHYLESSVVLVEGFKFYGSPYTPRFCDWGFNLDRGLPIRAEWSNIPDDTDVLITHGPPYGYGDKLSVGERVGCHDLLEEIRDRVRPKFHIFGHIHEGYGVYDLGASKLVNASICDEHYQIKNPPLVVDLD
jgi:hypothetical protein